MSSSKQNQEDLQVGDYIFCSDVKYRIADSDSGYLKAVSEHNYFWFHPRLQTYKKISSSSLMFKSGDYVLFDGEEGQIIQTGKCMSKEGTIFPYKVKVGNKYWVCSEDCLIKIYYDFPDIIEQTTQTLEEGEKIKKFIRDRFKVGDRVKIVESVVASWKGKTGYVKEIGKFWIHVTVKVEARGQKGQTTLPFDENELELVIDNEKFQVGDKVKFIRKKSCFTGKVGAISRIDQDYITVCFDKCKWISCGFTKQPQHYCVDDLELIERK